MMEIFDEIKKLYRFKSPCEELTNYIEFFSETFLDATNRYISTEKFTVKLFPSYTPTIWINLGSSYYLKNGGKCYSINQNTDILLLRNEIVERRNRPTDNMFTVKFFPGGFEAIFGFSQTKIGSDVINLNEIIPVLITQRLRSLSSFDDRISVLQDLFLESLKRNHRKDHYSQCINNAVESFCLSGMEAGTREIAGKLCMTDKTFYRYFKSVVGTNPKNYLGIIRARTALTAYVIDTKSFLPYDYGYYDMSHFYKDVVKFTGQKLIENKP
jgi:AraC-like DNA-binding protein